jgi:hypothetical protein
MIKYILEYIKSLFLREMAYDGYNPPPKNVKIPKKAPVAKPNIIQNNIKGNNILNI